MAVSQTIRRILSVYPIDLPVFHPIAIKLQHLLADNEFDIEEVIALASQDQVMASRILRMANSPAYRGAAAVETMKDAVVRLGAQQVANMTMAISHASIHKSSNEAINRYMRKLWHHSHSCALGCRWVATTIGLRRMAEQAYLAGLLHDIGKLYLLKVLEKLTVTGVACSALEEQTLHEVFIELHVEEGTKLMKHWNIPKIYTTVVEEHHASQCGVENLVLIIVRLVNQATCKLGISLHPDPGLEVTRLKEVGLLGIDTGKLSELETLLEDARSIVI
jgi:putative nucleotidyltransferase with HDIG domain